MAKDSNIVHQYFKKAFEGSTILVRVNPLQFKGIELTIFGDGQIEKRELEFDEGILDDLAVDGFEAASPMEFNLYLSGLL
ncbi:MAG: hypothetical protein ABIS36_07425 [Chryseolinea sp.]